MRPGTDVLIRYTGTQTSKAGRVFKGFEVFVADADALMEALEPRHPVFGQEVGHAEGD